MTWYKHETNTARDPRISRLKSTLGGAACFTYILLLEYLRDTETGRLNKADIPFMNNNLMEDADRAAAIINECLKLGLLEADGNFIYSPMILEQMKEQKETSEKRSLAGKKGQQAKKEIKEATAAALTAAESVASDTLKELVKEICDTFKVKDIKPYYYPYTEILIKAVTPINPKDGDGAAVIRAGLKAYRESEAIQSGAMGFNINSFFDPEKFTKLLSGDYDKKLPRKVKAQMNRKNKTPKGAGNDVTFSDIHY